MRSCALSRFVEQCNPLRFYTCPATPRLYRNYKRSHFFSSCVRDNDQPSFYGDLTMELQIQCEKGHLDNALNVLSRFKEHGAIPSERLYVTVLKTCQMKKSLTHAKMVLEHLMQERHDLNGLIGDFLVITLIKCGSLEGALKVFYSLVTHTVYSWSAVINGFLEFGRPSEALKMCQIMQDEGVEPNHYTFVSMLKACANVPSLQNGREIHEKIREKGQTSDAYIRTSLISMYSKCGSLLEAEEVFLELFQSSVVPWNAMLSAYVQNDQAVKAFHLYNEMLDSNINPNDTTYVILVQACGSLADKEDGTLEKDSMIKSVPFNIGCAIHGDVRKRGLTLDTGNALVTLYGKCKRVKEAVNVFHSLSQHSTVSWNGMMSAFIISAVPKLSLQLLNQMQKEYMNPNAWSFVLALQACCMAADAEEIVLEEGRLIKPVSLDFGKALHYDVEQKGFSFHPFVVNSLLTLYSRCGAIDEAVNVFVRSYCKAVVSWNAMLSAYVEQGQEQMALYAYRQMVEEGVQPNAQTLTIVIQACGNIAGSEDCAGTKEEGLSKVEVLEIGKALHADARKMGFASNAYIANTLIIMYGKCKMVSDSENVFVGFFQRNIVTWNSMLLTYVENRCGEKALNLFRQMQKENIHLTNLSFRTAIQACGTLVESPKADVPKRILQALHVDMVREDLNDDVTVSTVLISEYAKYGMLDEAESVFQNVVSIDSLLVSVMLLAYIESDQHDKALELYRKTRESFYPDETTSAYILQACSHSGNLDMCRELHFSIVSAGYDNSFFMLTTIIHTYGQCACMSDTHSTFYAVTCPDVVTWSASIAAHSREGNHKGVFQNFTEMLFSGLEPNRVAFISLLNACSHSGLVYDGIHIFISMLKDYDIIPDLKCYVGIVDVFGRAGDFIRVEKILVKIPPQDNTAVWLCVLGACHIHGNIDLGKKVFIHELNSQPLDPNAYVSMANIYSNERIH